MTIDRQGTAWVLYDDKTLYHVDTTDAHCAATSFKPNADMLNMGLGIGFASDAPGSSAETLYLSTVNGLSRLDPQALQVVPIGNFNVNINSAGLAPTLTGTSDARLFGVWGGTPTLTEIDPSNAHIISSSPLPAAVNKGYAAAFWGGDLWIFGNPGG